MYLNFLELDLLSIDKPTIVIVLAGQVIVVAVLFLLYKFYTVSIHAILRSIRKQKTVNEITDSEKTKHLEEDGDVNASIAMALYLHFNEMHDEESNVITIQREGFKNLLTMELKNL